jgi:hypothetical protein
MTPGFEAFLARLYTEPDARKRFLADPGSEAARAGLSEEEISAVERIDRVGLELAATSFAHKRRRRSQRRRSIVRLWNWLVRRLPRSA